MLAHVPSFGRNPRGSPDFLVYPVPKACMHVLGTKVPRCLGVARSASSPKAAQALGCSLTPWLWIPFGRVTCTARAASVPGLWTLGSLLLRGACVWVWVVVGFGFRLRPATPRWGVGVCVCLCACSACTPLLPAGVCGVGVCAWARVSAAPRHSWPRCWVVCVLVCAPRLHPATPGWVVRCGCVCFGSGFGCAPPLLAGMLGCVCACVRALLVPRHSWLGCAACVLCLGSGLGCAPLLLAGVSGFVSALCAPRLHPPTPGWGVRCGCVCLGSGFGCDPPRLAGVLWCACLSVCSPCTPPLLAGARGVDVCVWVPVLAAPRHSWLGCWGVCVVVWALPLYPATPGWSVRCGGGCLGSGFGCALPVLAAVCGAGVCISAGASAPPRHPWLGSWGVRVCVRAPLVPRLCWLECAAWVCVLEFGFQLRPATPGWGVGVWVCSCARSACSPPPLARVCRVGVGVLARVSAATHHFWLGCWGVGVCVRAPPVPRHSWLRCAVWVCVFGLGFRLRPATPGLAVEVCVCWCGCSPWTPPLQAGVCGVGAGVWAQVSAASRHSWLGCWGVCVCVRAPLVPRHSWLGCAAWVCVFGFEFGLRPTTPGLGVGVCVWWCGRSPRTPPLLAGVSGAGEGVRAPVSGAPRRSWLGCLGVRVGVRAPPVTRHSWLGCVAWVCVFGLGFLLRPATPG